MVRFLYITPGLRSRGAGRELLSLLERCAKETMGVRRLILKVRTYNERAMNCYWKFGFREYSR
ncbi:MAG: GNAT family N-acetyltransferase, partial [Synergistales bacterium]|nr:GNAT family N-acetyltransferase [Synergistales bacterium]